MKVNFDIEMKTLEGKVIPDSTATLIGNLLLAHTFKESDAVTKYGLATKIHNEKEAEVTTEEMALILKAIKDKDNILMPIAKAQLLIALDK